MVIRTLLSKSSYLSCSPKVITTINMGQPKSKVRKIKYSFKQKVSALKLLRENDFNYSKTAREHTLVYKTIQRWEQSIGDAVFYLLDKYNGDVTSVTEGEVQEQLGSVTDSEMKEDFSNQSFYKLVREVRMIALKRLGYLLPRERDINSIIAALKLLIEISKSDTNKEDNEETEMNKFLESLVEKYSTPLTDN